MSLFFSIINLRIRFIQQFPSSNFYLPFFIFIPRNYFSYVFLSLSSSILPHPPSSNPLARSSFLLFLSLERPLVPRSGVSLWETLPSRHSLLCSRGFDLNRLGEIAPRARADSSPLPVVPSPFLFDRLPSIHYNSFLPFFDRSQLIF